MKKFKIFLAIAIAAIATVAAGFYSYQATQENQLAQIELSALEANIEALTQSEGAVLMPPTTSSGSSQSTILVHVVCYDNINAVDETGSRVFAKCAAGSSNQPCLSWTYGKVASGASMGYCYQYQYQN